MAPPVHVVSLGACTPIGRNAASACAAVRAGINGFVQHPFMVDSCSQPMRGSIAPWLDIGLSDGARLVSLLMPAIDEVLEPLTVRRHAAAKLALALALPAPRPGVAADVVSQMNAHIRSVGRFAEVACFAQGHAGGLVALREAVGKLGRGDCDACVVAGVDSYIEPATLEWLDDHDQLHGAGRLNNAWGFIPGEGAAALLLTTQDGARRLGLRALTTVLAVGQAIEPSCIKTEGACIGAGLTQALQQALHVLSAPAVVSDIYCDLNGEPYRSDEFGFATLRTNRLFEDAGAFVAPADCWGDVGAASGPLLTCLAVHGDPQGLRARSQIPGVRQLRGRRAWCGAAAGMTRGAHGDNRQGQRQCQLPRPQGQWPLRQEHRSRRVQDTDRPAGRCRCLIR